MTKTSLKFHAYANSQSPDALGYVTGYELKSDAEQLAAIARKRGQNCAHVSQLNAIMMTSDPAPVVVNITRSVFEAEAVEPFPANHEPDFSRVYADELPAH